jgi:ferrous iron transport protein B
VNTRKSDRILLVGNPNVGKSVVFAYLTGRYAIVSNYPGTTVEISRGPARFDSAREVIDTPGVNSLFPSSEDEKVTRDILRDNPDATIIQVADAKNLFRSLLLTAQLTEMGCRLVLVLNMMDEARQRGITIDTDELSSSLGIEVVKTVAVEKRGLSRLVQLIQRNEAKIPRMSIEYPAPVRPWIDRADDALATVGEHGRFESLALLSDYEGWSGKESREFHEIRSALRKGEKELPNPFSYYVAEGIKESVNAILRRVAIEQREEDIAAASRLGIWLPTAALALVTILLYLVAGREQLAGAGLHPTLIVLAGLVAGITIAGEKLVNRLTMHPLWGIGILLIILYLIYSLVGVFAAGTLVDLLEGRLFGELIIPLLERLLGTGWFADILIGDYGLISMGVNYSISIVFPIVTVFFLVFGILEDTGYFPRLTVLTNRAFRIVGVNGKATLPIVLGFGCVTMSVLASRILETRKERIIVVVLLALAIPCSAQLGVILALMSAISGAAVILISAIILFLFVMVGLLMSRILKGATSDFIIELPPLRAPRFSNIMLKTGARARWFLKEALPFFILATLILYLLEVSGGLRMLERIVEPVVSRFLGLPSETAAVFIIGFFRRDYGAAGLYKLWESGTLAGNQVVVGLIVMSLFIPCLASLIVIIKELGLKIAALILLFVLSVSILCGGLLNLALGALEIQF